MAKNNCADCIHKDVCALWEIQNEISDTECVHYQPTLTPPNEPLTIEQLREMDGEPVWCKWLLPEESRPPHWNILDPFYAKHIEDYRYGENWLAYRRPKEGEADA